MVKVFLLLLKIIKHSHLSEKQKVPELVLSALRRGVDVRPHWEKGLLSSLESNHEHRLHLWQFGCKDH